MLYQKKVSVGQFAKKGVDFKDSDIITIASEGQQVQGTFGVQNVFLMKFSTGDKNMNVNQTSLNNIIDAYGPDSLQWIGKPVKVWLILQSVSGKMQKVAYLTHPQAEITEDGAGFRWEIPGKQAEAPVKPKRVLPNGVEYPEEDISPDDIGF